jgi:hypothetical protein
VLRALVVSAVFSCVIFMEVWLVKLNDRLKSLFLVPTQLIKIKALARPVHVPTVCGHVLCEVHLLNLRLFKK